MTPINPSSAFGSPHHQRCILLLDTTIAMAEAPINALNEGLAVLHQGLIEHPDLAPSLELGIIALGNGPTLVVPPKLVTAEPFPELEACGFTPARDGVAMALSYLRVPQGAPTPWFIHIASQPGVQPGVLSHQVLDIELSQALAPFHSLTITLNVPSNRLTPPGKLAFHLREHRFPQFFDWLVEAFDYRMQCDCDLPISTAYSWAHLDTLPHD